MCRVDDDWLGVQKKALKQILKVAIKNNADVAVIGDVFNSNSDVSFNVIKLVQDFALELKEKNLKLYMLAGNHDLLYHSTKNLDKSAIGILFNSVNIHHLSELGEDVSASNFDEEDLVNKKYVFKHILVFPSEDSKPFGVNAITAEELLNTFPKAKYIFTGDYHHNFHYVKNGRCVVNPGCLLRQAVDMKDYQCGVYFVDTDEEVVDFVPIIDNEGMIDDGYIVSKNERDDRIGQFVEKLQGVQSVTLDFVENVKRLLKVNKDLSSDVVEVVEELVGLV